MTRIFRVGALASATLTLAAMFGAHAEGAFAETTSPERAISAPVPSESESEQPTVRFVASEVVQDISEQVDRTVPADVDMPDAETLRQLVAEVPVDDAFPRELRCLAQGVYFEARGEPVEGQLAVAQVIVNRAESSVFPDDYCSVITQRSQFSFVKGGHIPEPRTSSAACSVPRPLPVSRTASCGRARPTMRSTSTPPGSSRAGPTPRRLARRSIGIFFIGNPAHPR